MKISSITQLKNDLSAHLKQVMAGETLLITDHRKPVARLQPLCHGDRASELSGLYARGIVAPPARRFSAAAFFHLPKGRATEPLTEAILEEREER